MKTSLAMLVTVIVSLGVLVYWLSNRFGDTAALVALTAILVFVALTIHKTIELAGTRSTMQSFVDYAQSDAQVDRYRQQTLLEGQKMARIGMQQDTMSYRESLRQQRQLPDTNQRAASYDYADVEDVDYQIYQ